MDKISGGLIDLEVNKIIANKNPRTNNVAYTLIVHTEDKDLGVLLLSTIEVLRDYNGNIGDYILVKFAFPAGDYIKDIHPKKSNLEISIIVQGKDFAYLNRYKLVITNNNNDMYGSKYTKLSREDLNKQDPIIVEGQCIQKEIEAVRGYTVNGIYRNTTISKLITSEFINNFSKFTIDGAPVKMNINLAKPNNDFNYAHIIIPTGTGLMDLPSYLQGTSYGVYNGYVGTYFQKYGQNRDNFLFVYPLYDETRFDNTEIKLMIFNSNTHKLDHIENTYMVDGDIVKIIAGYNTKSIDTGENDLINSGVAITSVNPYVMMERNALVTNENMKVYSSAQMQGQGLKNRSDGVNMETYLGPQSNLYKSRSFIVKKTMAIYQVTWNFPDIDLIYPGMPVMYVFEDENNNIVKLTGTVQSIYSRYNQVNKTTTAILNIAVIKPAIHME